MTSYDVRVAEPDDFSEVWRLFLLAYEENAILPLCQRKAEWYIRRAIEPHKIHPLDTGPRGVIGVIGPKGDLQGAVFLIISSFWYTEQMHIEELSLLVDPKYRKTDHAKTLINWMKDQSSQTGLPLVTGVISNHRTEAKVRLYGRLLPQSGAFFVLKPEDVTMRPTLVVSSSLEQIVNRRH